MTRGRPKNVARRLEIALCAASLFASNGYGGTTMDEIAEAARITPSLLYHYFPRKADILTALAEQNGRRLQQLGRDTLVAIRSAHTCEEYLRAIGRSYIDYLRQWHHFPVLWFMNIAPFEAASQPLRQSAKELYQVFGRRLGALPDYRSSVDPVAALRLFVGQLLCAVLFQERVKVPLTSRAGYDDVLEDAVQLAVRGCTGAARDRA